MKFSERKQQEYYKDITSWNWTKAPWEVMVNEEADSDNLESDDFYEQEYIGTVFGLTPSGKIYTFWTTNQTGRDEILDRAWWAALEHFTTERNWWIDSFDENIYVCRAVEDWVLWVNEKGEVWKDQPWPKNYTPKDVPEDYEPMDCDGDGTPYLPASGVIIF